MINTNQQVQRQYVGTLVGESTSTEFRLAVAHGAIKEQDIIAVDATLEKQGGGEHSRDKQGSQAEPPEEIRVWAKVKSIERLNPLFPTEAGHELAATHTNPLDTIISLSREMVTAVCQVLGYESIGGNAQGKLNQLRYPAQPATSAYRPIKGDIARIVLGELQQKHNRALDIATLANRSDIDVMVDGHAIVTRHLAILAMTGAGKSVTARRLIEELAKKQYPIVIFDPHGDYTGLGEIDSLKHRVRRYYAQFPVFEQEEATVISVIESLGWKLANTHLAHFGTLFRGAKAFIQGESSDKTRANWLSTYLNNPKIAQFGLKPNLFSMADFVQAVIQACKTDDTIALKQIGEWCGEAEALHLSRQIAGWLDGLSNNLRRAANRLYQMEEISRKAARTSDPLPNDRTELVQYAGISIVALAGYTSDFQATIYNLIANEIFGARVSHSLKLPVLFVLEEAHNFAPAKANTAAEEQAITTTKQIAQEGRKFGVGLVLISQRPSRLDETTLSQCNSFIIMRMVNPADQGFVRKVIESLGEDDARLLPDLDVGEALISGQMINFPVLVKMKKPVSEGEHEEEDAFVALEKARLEAEAVAAKAKNKGK
jgi:hypothetical protein